MSEERFITYSGNNLATTGNRSPYPVQRLAAPISLVDTAREIEQASALIGTRANAQLELIAEQIRRLQDDARRVLATAQADMAIHEAECSCRRIPGQIYHLYQRAGGGTLLSKLSPADYGGRPPNHFLGSYRLELDQSWTRTSDE